MEKGISIVQAGYGSQSGGRSIMIRKRLKKFLTKNKTSGMSQTERISRQSTKSSGGSVIIQDELYLEEEYSIDDWKPKYPALQEWKTWREALLFSVENERIDFSNHVEKIADGVFYLQCFQPELLQKIAAEIVSVEQWAVEHNVDITPPNSMHDYGITVDTLRLETVLQNFVSTIADEFVRQYFPELSISLIDHHHSFTVTYGQQYNRSLGFHADDAEVTFNFCLDGDFIGSELYFQGRRCFEHMQTAHRPEEHIEVEQKVGWCIVHAGLHRHGVLPILQGERRSLIVWSRSQQHREKSSQGCHSWCEYSKEE